MTTLCDQNKLEHTNQIKATLLDSLTAIINSPASPDPFVQCKIEIPRLDLVRWLYHQKSETKIYWSNRDTNNKIAAIAQADLIANGNPAEYKKRIDDLLNLLEQTELPVQYFGGLRFDRNYPASSDWKKFGDYLFLLPRFEIREEDGKYYFIMNLKQPFEPKIILDEIEALEFSFDQDISYTNEIINRTDYPDHDLWCENIDNALSSIGKNKFEKIVLARQSELTMKNIIKPEIILNRLINQTSNCYHYFFKLDDNHIFLGATPERLYERDGNDLKCEALAGTIARNESDKLDQELGNSLLNSEKDVREHQYVIRSIFDALQNHVENSGNVTASPVSLLKLTRVQHLLSRIVLVKHNHVTDYDLIDRLHPTAAVGGYPKANSLNEISAIEKFDRGWYAAPIGWLGDKKTEMAVSLRCALINGNQIKLYSGAGIVDGSQPEDEWHEIENKISNFLKLLS